MSVGLRLDAPAKLNLDLRVVGRREDGHHLLESTFVLLELADRLLLTVGSAELRVDGERAEEIPLDETNLAWRGLAAGLGSSPARVRLRLDKRIPVTAGLGGGSSDAAAAWRLGRAHRGRPDRAANGDLEELARIGADVPFFAAGVAAARVGGIGERIQPLAPVSAEVVLVHPPFGLSTAAIFAELRTDEWGSRPNDLLAPALRLRPELGEVLDAVRRAGAEPRLTGSGPTVFCLLDDPRAATALVETLQRAGLRVTATRTRTSAASIEASDQEE